MKAPIFGRITRQMPKTILRYVELESQRYLPRKKTCQKKLFNLDLHVSVIKDISMGLSDLGVDVTSWSISRHNHVFRKFFTYPDPVRHINAQNWRKIDENKIDQFVNRYSKFLNQFDGFVVTHTPVFHEIFSRLDKPILIINSTRYESPYSSNQEEWEKLNSSLIRGVASGQTLIYSNNQGDSNYLEYFTGLKSEVVPSLCTYTEVSWTGESGQYVYFGNRLTQYVKDNLRKQFKWQDSSKIFGNHFSWNQLRRVSAVFIVPYNISTMQLFELSSAGIPVVIPSKSFLSQLFLQESSLGEVSYFQVENLCVDGLSTSDPNNFKSGSFLKYWMDSADFYNQTLMPNVYTVDSFEELATFTIPAFDGAYKDQIRFRNESLRNLQHNSLSAYIEKL